MYKLGDFNIRATYSNGFKAPTLKELHDDYITQIGGGPWKHYYGNKDLKPQKSNYYSASVEYHASNLQITVTGFYNRIKNMIALTRSRQAPKTDWMRSRPACNTRTYPKPALSEEIYRSPIKSYLPWLLVEAIAIRMPKRNIRMIRPTRIICSTPRSTEPHSIMPIGN